MYRINKLTVQIEKEAEQRRLSELKALQAQMNPHFMLNAMNAVNYMALNNKITIILIAQSHHIRSRHINNIFQRDVKGINSAVML